MTSTKCCERRMDGLAMLEAVSVALLCEGGRCEEIGLELSSTKEKKQTLTKTESINNASHLPSPENSSIPISSHVTTCNSSSVTALLNPLPTVAQNNAADTVPHGFVVGKDGKIKKKRGRKPTPGLTDEDRRQARLLKNRRTAETSRRRKLALLNRLTEERNEAKKMAQYLQDCNEYLVQRLANVIGVSVASLTKNDPKIGACSNITMHTIPHSDISIPSSVVDSDDDRSLAHLPIPSSTPTAEKHTMSMH